MLFIIICPLLTHQRHAREWILKLKQADSEKVDLYF